jgi:hypothetical protein
MRIVHGSFFHCLSYWISLVSLPFLYTREKSIRLEREGDTNDKNEKRLFALSPSLFLFLLIENVCTEHTSTLLYVREVCICIILSLSTSL